MENSLNEAFACGIDGLKWACELYFEHYNSSLGMERCIYDLKQEDSRLASSKAVTWEYKNRDDAMNIYNAMKSFGVEIWFSAYLKKWISEGKNKEELLEIMSEQYDSDYIERVKTRILTGYWG